MDELTKILDAKNIQTPARIVAARLRETGWLIPTGQNGVWEFAPAELAGAYSSGDPMIGFKSYLIKHPDSTCGLTFQAAAWAHGFSDRLPIKPEVAVQNLNTKKSIPTSLSASVYKPELDYEYRKNVPVLAKESIFVHMCEKPSAVRSWESAMEWLTELALELTAESLITELSDRPQSVKSRTGYLLKGFRPDLSLQIYRSFKPMNKTWFGPRNKLIRHDNKWLIADTILPFDPERIGE